MTSQNAMAKKPKKTARVNTGESTNQLVHSAFHECNNVVFREIMMLYVAAGSIIADVTFGKGVFWKNVDIAQYDTYFSDLRKEGLPDNVQGSVDSRRLPYPDEHFDTVVFDPPYMHTPGGTAHNGHQNFEAYYANNAEQDPAVMQKIWAETSGRPPKYHEAVLDLYFRSAREAWRVLKREGIYIVKCQDEVCSNRQRLTHIELTNELQGYGFVPEDIFIVVRKHKPGVSRIKKQCHARKNHSYFMVYRKPRLKASNKTVGKAF